ncbi:MAG: DJ-1/PfpI family protein [Candidatus Aenigmatarchaeota archaeon]
MPEKRVLMVIAPRNFRDEEYFDTKAVLSKKADIVTASTTTDQARGMLGGTVSPDTTLDEAKPEEYDAVVFVGGTGAKVYFGSSRAKAIAKEAFDAGKVVAAICIAPTVLANAGVLEGKNATVWNDPDLISNLEEKGAKFQKQPVVRDGNIVTGEGPHAAKAFGEEIARALG